MGAKQGSVRSLFVTSTFRDMHAERDWLRNHVFPVLEERLRERGLRLEPVDLRWGVQTVDEGGEEAKELLVLKVCLGEIERSRPFLIALIGDRYGWVPPSRRAGTAAREAGLKGEWRHKSITALELEHGALSVPEQRRRCFVYLRNPLPYGEMPPSLAAEYSDAYHLDRAAGLAAAKRLARLKERLKRELGSRRVRSYGAEWDARQGRVTGLEAFGRQVLEDLWVEFEKELGEYRAPASDEEAEELEIERYAAEQAEGFVGRRTLVAELKAFARGRGGGDRCLCLAGPAGSGKSALMARLYRELNQGAGRGGRMLTIYHPAGLSIRTGRLDWALRRWIAALADAAGMEVRIPKKADLEKLGEVFQKTLEAACATRRVVLLVDALNQFERSVVAEYVQWLPERLPQGCRVICTAIPGKETKALLGRTGIQNQDLPAFSAADAAELIQDLCARHRRQIHPDIVRVLLGKKAGTGQGCACGNLLWLKTAVEELNLLDEDDFRRARKAYRGSEDQRLHKLVLNTAKAMDGTADGLYWAVLARLQDAYGERQVRSLMEWIAVSRTGWRESDLEALWKEVSKSPWDPLRFAAIRRGLCGHMVQRGTLGQWDFAHPQLRQAILGGMKKTTLHRRHRQIAAMLEKLPEGDASRIRERMFHLIGADDHREAAFEYALAEGESLVEASRTLAGHALADWTEQRHPGMDWILGLLDPELGDELLEELCNQFIFNLAEEMSRDPRLGPQLIMLDQSRKALEGLRARHPRNRDVRRNLSVSYDKLAGVAEERGEWSEAEKLYRKAQAITVAMAKASQENGDFRPDLSIHYERLAGCAEKCGSWPEAEKLYRKALIIREALAKASPENVDFRQGLSISYERLAGVADQRGDWPEAERLCRKALAIAEALAKASPEDIDCQRNLSKAYIKLAGLAVRRGAWEVAEKLYLQTRVIMEALAKASPENLDFQRGLSASIGNLARVAESRGEWGAAERLYRKAQSIWEVLVHASPNSVEFQRNLSVNTDDLARAAESRGEWRAAEKLYRKAMAIWKVLVHASPKSVDYQRGLSVTCDNLARMAELCGEWGAAEKLYRKALAITEALAKASPENIDFRRDLACSYGQLGLLLKRKNAQHALTYIDSALDLFRRLEKMQQGSKPARRDVADALLDDARVRVSCGRRSEAKQHLAEAEQRMRKLENPELQVKRLLVVAELELAEGQDGRNVAHGIRTALKLIHKHSLARLRKDAEELLERCKPRRSNK